MQSSHASRGDSSSFPNNDNNGSNGPPCRCGRSTKLLKAWTDENPGRRFFSCSVHGFTSWFDKEDPHGWQMISLLEARDEIQQQRGRGGGLGRNPISRGRGVECERE
uniref:Zinc finger GRF-type domain-containing protein n=1 Tax=Brassica oleracea var. oleracea TaxID=109376 RepID=A0A0D3AXG2_BRAOL